jgi:putative tryptophan/tyrosine transport system substrate-binding protein
MIDSHWRRRSLLAAAAAGAVAIAADSTGAQTPKRVLYLAAEDLSKVNAFPAVQKAFERSAPNSGLIVHLEYRQVVLRASDHRKALLAAIDSGCDAMIAHTGGHARALAQEYQTADRIHKPPVVFASFSDPVKLGLVESLARPGGRLTGVALADTSHGKRLELLQEAFGQVRAVGVLLDRKWVGVPSFEHEIGLPAAKLGLTVQRFDADTPEELDRVMHSTQAARMDAWYVANSYIVYVAEARVIEHLRRLQRPAIHTFEREVSKGGTLMAYASDHSFVFSTMADLTLRVLRGEDPASIPVQRPRRFVLAVRPRPGPAALQINPSIIRRADRIY